MPPNWSRLKGALARNQGQLTTARAAFDKAMAVKQAFMREKERKTQEALNAIADYRRSQWQKKVADAMEQFEVAGISQTHDEMVRKIEETTAVNEARMDMALGNVDQQKIKIEEEAEKMQANELVKQFKVEMGLTSPQAAAPAGCGKNHCREGAERTSKRTSVEGGTADARSCRRGPSRRQGSPSTDGAPTASRGGNYMAVKIERGGWVLIFLIGLALVGYSLNDTES